MGIPIGVELYTAPRIWVPSSACTIKQGNNGKYACYDTFTVEQVEIADGKIVSLTIRNENTGKAVFSNAKRRTPARQQEGTPTMEQSSEIAGLIDELAEKRGVDKGLVLSSLMKSKAVITSGANGEIKTAAQAEAAIGQLRTWMKGLE